MARVATAASAAGLSHAAPGAEAEISATASPAAEMIKTVVDWAPPPAPSRSTTEASARHVTEDFLFFMGAWRMNLTGIGVYSTWSNSSFHLWTHLQTKRHRAVGWRWCCTTSTS